MTRFPTLACAALLASLSGLYAQLTIPYDDGETDGNAYSTSAPNDPITLTIASGSSQQSGALTGNGAVIKTGAGQVSLSSPGTNYTGTTTISEGTLQITNNGGFNSPITVTATGALDLYIANDVNLLQGISGSGPVSVSGDSATARLSGNNSGYTGTFTLPSNARGIMWSSPSAGSASANWVISGDFALIETGTGDHTVQLGSLSGIETNSELGGFGGTGTKTFEIGALNSDTTYAGKIIDGGPSVAISKIGTGTLTLTGSSNYSGATSVNGGTLTISSGGDVVTEGVHVGENGNTGALVVAGNGSTLLADDFLTVGDFTASAGTGTMTISNMGVVRIGSGAKLTVGWQGATGTVNLNSRGTLQVGGTDGIQKHATGTTNFNWSGGTIQVVDSALTTSVPMTLTGSSFFNTNGFDAHLSGNLTGSGGFTKSGPGVLFLLGNNTYAGETTIASGQVVADSNGLGTNAVGLLSGAALLGYGDATITNMIDVSLGAGTLGNYGGGAEPVFSGTVALHISDLNVYSYSDNTSSTTVSGGITGNGNITLTSGGGASDAASVRITGIINSTGNITNNGAGTGSTVISGVIGANITGVSQNSATSALILEADNLYTGPTTVTTGTLKVDGSIAGTVAVALAGLLGGDGEIGDDATINGTLAPGNSAGLLTFDEDLTLNLGSTTAIELGGILPANFDRISVDSILTYGGTLSISIINGFAPQIGDSFQIFKDFDSQSGTFTSIAFSNPAYSANFNYGTGTLQFTAIPEPSTWALLAAGGLLGLLRRRARRS